MLIGQLLLNPYGSARRSRGFEGRDAPHMVQDGPTMALSWVTLDQDGPRWMAPRWP